VVAYLANSSRGTSIMEHHPTQVIGSTYNCPEFVARDAVVEYREAEVSRDFTVPYFVVALLERTEIQFEMRLTHPVLTEL